jgi:alkylation response protein AidB-like acyl-CoA dehydrogenase
VTVAFTEDQEELRRYARRWLDERAPLDHVRAVMETHEGFDRGQWHELGELGWLGMAVPEEFGGAGYGFAELAVLAEEMGRSLYPSPFLSSVVMATSAVQQAGTDDQRQRLLPALAAGATRATLALTEVDGSWEPRPSSTTASAQGDGWVVDGTKHVVLDGHTADLLIVTARVGEDTGLFLIEQGAPGLTVERVDPLDLTRPLATVEMTGVEAERLGQGDSVPVVEHALTRAVAALAMEQVGGAQSCLDMSVDYAKHRHQFGRPIGSFQAIKHMCADMLVAVESARSAAYHLAGVLDGDEGEAAIAAPLAKAYVSEAYFTCAADAIQIHGGIGFTWEHDAHLHLKRAKSSHLLFGLPTMHRSALAARLGL